MPVVGLLPVVQSVHHVSIASEPQHVDGISNLKVQQKKKLNRKAEEGGKINYLFQVLPDLPYIIEYEFLVQVTDEHVRQMFNA